ncbi:hypothetical protein PIB30_109320, partial [Stylosanthes scabra]|nr:hypothetical protein [Stylosanthes scabra]
MVTKPIHCTHMRRRPRICMVDQQSSHTPSRLHNQNVTLTSPSFKDPRIGVKVHAYAWKDHSSHVPESRLAQPKRDQDFSKPKSATHMRGVLCICVGNRENMLHAEP